MGVLLRLILTFRAIPGRLALLLAAPGVLAFIGLAAPGPSAAGHAQSAVFPEKLLEGSLVSFDLAILAQGDLRGSFGPCG